MPAFCLFLHFLCVCTRVCTCVAEVIKRAQAGRTTSTQVGSFTSNKANILTLKKITDRTSTVLKNTFLPQTSSLKITCCSLVYARTTSTGPIMLVNNALMSFCSRTQRFWLNPEPLTYLSSLISRLVQSNAAIWAEAHHVSRQRSLIFICVPKIILSNCSLVKRATSLPEISELPDLMLRRLYKTDKQTTKYNFTLAELKCPISFAWKKKNCECD